MTRTLHLALQDGFDSDSVVVVVGEHEVYRHDDVRTDARIGLATSFEAAIPAEPVTVTVRLPRRDVDGSQELPGTQADGSAGQTDSLVYLGVSYVDGGLRFRASAAPFGYV